jgi:hypothetical protein
MFLTEEVPFMQPDRDEMLEPIFELPEEVIRDPGMRAMYFHIVERMRRQLEESGLGHDAAASMLAERCAFLYITLRQKESRLSGIGYVGNQQVSLNKLWLEFQREFVLMVRGAPKKQAEMWQKMQEIIFKVVEQQSPSMQRKLSQDFLSAFEHEKV